MSKGQLSALAGVVGIALAVAGCTPEADASTQKQKSTENSTDPTTSEQIPIQEETQGSVESYDEDGDVPVGEFIYGDDATEIINPISDSLELNEEMSDVYEILRDVEIIEIRELLSSRQNIQITGSIYAISIPMKDNISLDYSANINFFKVGESRWKIDKTFIVEKDGRPFQIMEVESSNNNDNRILLIESKDTKIEEISEGDLKQSEYQVFEDLENSLKLGIVESFKDLSSLQQERGITEVPENWDNIFNIESLSQLEEDGLTEDQYILLEETLNKILAMIKSLDNPNQDGYYSVRVWSTGDDLLVTYSLERLNPAGQLEKFEELSQQVNQEVISKDDNSLLLTQDVYIEAIFKFIRDPNNTTFSVEDFDMKELPDLIRLQEIVNAYDDNGEMNFQEYILSIKNNIKKEDSLYDLIDALSNYNRLDDVRLAEFLHDEVPSLNIIDVTNWSVSNSFELIPEHWWKFLEEFKDRRLPQEEGRVGTLEYNGVGFMGEIPLRLILKGDLVFKVEYPLEDSDLIIILDKMETDSGIVLLGTTMEEKDWKFLVIEEWNNADAILGSGHRYVLGVRRDIR